MKDIVDEGVKMKVSLANVRGVNDRQKLHSVLQQFRNIDVAILVETKLKMGSRANIEMITRNFGGVFSSYSGRAAKGVTIVVKAGTGQILETKTDNEGHFVIIIMKIKEKNILMGGFYGSSEQSDAVSLRVLERFVAKVDQSVQQYQVDGIVIAGDWNFVTRQRDTTTATRKAVTETAWGAFQARFQLEDVAEYLGLDGIKTYEREGGNRIIARARLDRVYCTPDLLPETDMVIQRKRLNMDHKAIITKFDQIQRGAKIWKFDDRLLYDQEVRQRLEEEIRNELRNHFVGPWGEQQTTQEIQEQINLQQTSSMQTWEKIITRTRNFAMAEMRRREESRVDEEKDAMKRFFETREALFSVINPRQEIIDAHEVAKLNLREVQGRKYNKAAAQNHIRFAKQGERMTSYHFNRLKFGLNPTEIKKLVVNGREIIGYGIVTHLTEKLSENARRNPAAESMTIQEFLGPLTEEVPKLNDVERDEMMEAVTENELKEIIRKLERVSSPGPLGISNELLKFLFSKVPRILTELMNGAIQDTESFVIPPWFSHRIVTLIPKPGRPVTSDQAYRGLSLLENSWKLLTKILANRMAKPVKRLISTEQYGFTKNRTAAEATRVVLDLINHSKQSRQPLIIMGLDFEKAFDTLSHHHVVKMLELLDLPGNIVELIGKLLGAGTLNFRINGELSQEVKLDAGTGQGCCMSTVLFLVALMALMLWLEKDEEVPGYQVDDIKIPAVAFADDITLLLQGDRVDDIQRTLQKIQVFFQVSGLRLNQSKSEILPINCQENDIIDLVNNTGVRRVNEIKHLGTIITDSANVEMMQNYEPIVQKLEELYSQHRDCYSTPLGRAVYVKGLFASKYFHRLLNSNIDEETSKKIFKTMLKMLWARSRTGTEQVTSRVHIAKGRVIQETSNGGLSIPRPDIQQKTSRMFWLRRMRDGEEHRWKAILEHWLSRANRPNILMHFNLGRQEWRKTAQFLQNISEFWSAVFKDVAELMKLQEELEHEFWQAVPLVGTLNDGDNQDSINFNNRTVRWIEAGFITLSQVFRTDIIGRIIPGELKTRLEIQQEFMIEISIMSYNKIIRLAQQMRNKNRMFWSDLYPGNQATMTLILNRNKRGGGHFKGLILKNIRKGWNDGAPPAFHTYRQDRMIQNLTADQFKMELGKVRKNCLPPATQWTSIQVFLRTLWTNKKERNSQRNNNNNFDDSCSNCGGHLEDTRGLLYGCHKAEEVRLLLEEAINDALVMMGKQNIHLTLQGVLFHRIENTEKKERDEIIPMIMIMKHVLYKMKFREDRQNFPSPRRILANMIVDLEKHLEVTRFCKRNSEILEIVITHLRNFIGF